MHKVNYRHYLTNNDKQRIREITESVNVFNPYEVDISEELAEDNLKKGADKSEYKFLLAEVEGEVVGYTCYGPTPCTFRRYDIFWIVVHRNFRGMGIGKQLLKITEEIISVCGGKRIYVETSSRDDYEPTRQFYIKCGYEEAAMVKDFYDDGDSKVIYVKVLN